MRKQGSGEREEKRREEKRREEERGGKERKKGSGRGSAL
jgi:hypothetical protein